MLDIGVGPGMARGMGLLAGGMGEITAHITRRDAKRAAQGAEDAGVVLAYALPLLQRLGAGVISE